MIDSVKGHEATLQIGALSFAVDDLRGKYEDLISAIPEASSKLAAVNSGVDQIANDLEVGND